MKIKGVFLVLLTAYCLLLTAGIAEAQFGKNNVRYGQLDQFYESYRFDIWHNLDTSDPAQKEYLEIVIANLENARNEMGGERFYNHTIEKRIPIFLCKTHSCMESLNLVGGFLPEGVGAFAEVERRRMALKLDFSEPLSRSIGVHELAHEFQFDIWDPSPFEIQRIKITGQRPRPQWFGEGGAEYMASFGEPHTRGDIRRDGQRITSSDRHFIPTWEALNRGQVNPYSDGAMVFEFLEEKFSTGVAFQVQGFKQIKVGLGELIYDFTKGELGNPDVDSEKFNQAITRFWMDKYRDEFNARSKPDEKNDNFEGRLVMPWRHSAPMSSPVRSPDGAQLAAFTVFKYGVGLGKYEIPRDKVYVSKEERKKLGNGSKAFGPNGSGELVNLTPQLPPVPWEYIISQSFETFKFNGFDASWSPDGKRIAFFAKVGRDHALVLIDSETRKILQKIELPLDQAFSPSFAPNGELLVFSAAKDVTRDIYRIKLESGEIENLTKDTRYDTAPQFSPVTGKAVYVGSDGDFQHLFLIDFSNGTDRIVKEQLTFGDFNDGWPSWSDDGSTIVYASDEADGIWNLYTLELSTKTVKQWTEFPLGMKTPIFAKGTTDTVYYVSPAEDTQGGYVYDKLFEAKLKKPIREYTVRDTGPAGVYAFNPSRDLFKFELDENQLLNPTPAPEKWACGGGNVQFGIHTYWGMIGQGFIKCSNLLETKEHAGFYLTRGDFRLIDYSYVNREKRTSWIWGAHQYRMPYHVQFYDVVHRYPAQAVLNNTWITETAIDLHTGYPLDKFNRVELFSSVRNRSFYLFGNNIGDLNEDMFIANPDFTAQDIHMYRFLRNSAGSNFVFGAAYVRDTVLYSGNTWGPFHGNAFRAQVEFAPPLGEEFQGYTSVNVAARTYRHLGSSSLLAGQAKLMANTRENGDFMLLCGPEMLRGCEYGSIVGNQVGYASVELRFPVPGTYLFGLPVRAFLFGDAAYARFNDKSNEFPAQKMKTYGIGLQYVIPLIGLPAQSVWTRDNGKWKPTFYITLHW